MISLTLCGRLISLNYFVRTCIKAIDRKVLDFVFSLEGMRTIRCYQNLLGLYQINFD